MLRTGRLGRVFRILAAACAIATVALTFTESLTEQAIRKARAVVTSRGTIVWKDGIPRVCYGGSAGGVRGPQANPVAVCHAGLAHCQHVAEGDSTAALLFRNCADWLVENAMNHGDWATLEYYFPFPCYNMVPPWRSGMAQGCALDVLTKADSLIGDPKYLQTAKRLLAAFAVDIENGGVRDTTVPAGWWYEEYADEGRKPSYVLNGMVFALFGIHRYYEYTVETDTDAKLYFDKGVAAVSELLPEFDRRTASMYDLAGRAASDNYHAIHVRQLHRLYEMTQVQVFKDYAERWTRFQSRPMIVRLALRPTALGFAVLGVNVVIAAMLLTLARLLIIGYRRRSSPIAQRAGNLTGRDYRTASSPSTQEGAAARLRPQRAAGPTV